MAYLRLRRPNCVEKTRYARARYARGPERTLVARATHVRTRFSHKYTFPKRGWWERFLSLRPLVFASHLHFIANCAATMRAFFVALVSLQLAAGFTVKPTRTPPRAALPRPMRVLMEETPPPAVESPP